MVVLCKVGELSGGVTLAGAVGVGGRLRKEKIVTVWWIFGFFPLKLLFKVLKVPSKVKVKEEALKIFYNAACRTVLTTSSL